MDKEEFLASGLLEQYVLGLTTPEEDREVERFARMYPDIAQRLKELRRGIEKYTQEQDLPVKKNRRPIEYLLYVASVVFAVCFLWQWAGHRQTIAQLSATEAAFATFKEHCENDRKENAAAAQVYELLRAPHTHHANLRGTALAPDAHAMIYWNPEKRRVYCSLTNLPPPPAGKQYQLWAEVRGEMVNMGILTAIPIQLQAVIFIEAAESFNITLEPIGGSEHPNVAQLYASGKV